MTQHMASALSTKSDHSDVDTIESLNPFNDESVQIVINSNQNSVNNAENVFHTRNNANQSTSNKAGFISLEISDPLSVGNALLINACSSTASSISSKSINKASVTSSAKCTPNVGHNLLVREKKLAQREEMIAKKENQLKEWINQYQNELSYCKTSEFINIDKLDTIEEFKSDSETNINTPGVHNNWSWLWKYHSVDSEIPANMQPIVSLGLLVWKITTFGLILNLFIIGLIAFRYEYYESTKEKATHLFTALLWTVIGIPVSYSLWYLNLYKMAINARLDYWVAFIVSFVIHCGFSVLMLSGCPWYPCAGFFFSMTYFFEGNMIGACLGTINTLVWLVNLILSIKLYYGAKNMSQQNMENKDSLQFKTKFIAMANKLVNQLS